jgi:glutamate N-acetyltransferase/amino-acid N-acetyltransferase
LYLSIMPVGLDKLPVLHPVPGIRLGTTMAAIRKAGRRDLVLIACDAGTHAAAVFTQNQFAAAPVVLARDHLQRAAPRALLINTGFANAATSEAGYADARACCAALAQALGCTIHETLPFSTGVIGERLPVDRVTDGIPACVEALRATGWEDAAHGIMTTDTVAKGSSRQFELDGKTVTITGIAKGAGMIQPNMATMLAFIATDAALSPTLLQSALRAATDGSFNRITVDGDTSTNDACVLLATGRAGNRLVEDEASAGYHAFARALEAVTLELAQAIIRDAEGATKFVTVEVVGGHSDADCREAAYAIATSPLVKTALFASDPNWGRIVAAVGRARIAPLDTNEVSVDINGVRVFERGAIAPGYSEAQGAAAMRESEILLRVSLGSGAAAVRVWTCDLSHDYVRINAEYRS